MDGQTVTSLAGELARFAATLAWDDIPPEVRDRAKLQILDALGTGLAAHAYPFARAVDGIVALGGTGPCSVLGRPERLPPRDAAMANGLLMHGLDTVITAAWFDDYYATVNPFFFLRDLAGALVLAGVALAAFRRYLSPRPRLRTGVRDLYAIAILAAIMLSGIGLIGLKITSHSEFMRMVEEYAGLDDEEELTNLTRLFAQGYNAIFTAKTSKIEVVKEDAQDNKFLECAVALDSKIIVSGDRHLKDIKRYIDIDIMSPREFIDLYNDGQIRP